MPANYDTGLIPSLQDYPVKEIYGKFPSDLVGGGRPSYMGTPLSRRELAEYISTAHDHGIAFNYLLNSSCLGNREWSSRWQRNLMRLLDRLTEMGVRRLTISTPYLLELVKERRPDFRVKVGIYAQIDTPARARFWEDLGADALTLESLTINRNFPRLRAIHRAVSIPLQLIANHICMPNCPLQSYHQNGFAHASDGSGGVFLDYCLFNCTRRRLDDPSLFIRSPWIRPEDLEAYESIGYSRIKLTERGIPSEELLKRVRAYSNRRFDGNLAEILLPYGFPAPVEKSPLWFLKYFLRPGAIWPWKLKPFLDLARQQGMMFPKTTHPIRIHAERIPDDFLQEINSRDCESMICSECRYCADVAESVVEIDTDFRTESLQKLADVQNRMQGGELWNV